MVAYFMLTRMPTDLKALITEIYTCRLDFNNKRNWINNTVMVIVSKHSIVLYMLWSYKSR